jgi:hypothetical protein
MIIADDLDGGWSPEPRCPAEEMALRPILGRHGHKIMSLVCHPVRGDTEGHAVTRGGMKLCDYGDVMT